MNDVYAWLKLQDAGGKSSVTPIKWYVMVTPCFCPAAEPQTPQRGDVTVSPLDGLISPSTHHIGITMRRACNVHLLIHVGTSTNSSWTEMVNWRDDSDRGPSRNRSRARLKRCFDLRQYDSPRRFWRRTLEFSRPRFAAG